MRPLYAIAPLALVLALLAPSTQITPSFSTWSHDILDWVLGRKDANASSKIEPPAAAVANTDSRLDH